MSSKKVNFDSLRTLAFGGILATYVAIGNPASVNARIMRLVNDTNAGMIFSDDNTDANGKIYLPQGTYLLIDLTSNLVPGHDDGFVIAKNTTFYVKYASAPTSGGVYLEYMYGNT